MNKETEFKREIHKVNHWILYCKENIRRGKCDMGINWGIELADTESRKRKMIQEFVANN